MFNQLPTSNLLLKTINSIETCPPDLVKKTKKKEKVNQIYYTAMLTQTYQ